MSFFNELESNPDPESRQRIIVRLHQIIRPYNLRRVQADLDFDIPKKLEVTMKCLPSPLQRSIIAKAATSLTSHQKAILARKVSNSPALFLSRHLLTGLPPAYIMSRSPKMQLLDRIVKKLIITKHRFLIYSQWTSMMDLIGALFAWRGVKFSRIDGSLATRARMSIIKEFVTPGSPIDGLLLSTRSSAFGLNLQVADTIVLFDSDYNPFVELQASSRAHRLGQQNAVVVVRLLMDGTGEERILKLSRRKYLLGNQIIEGGRFNLKISPEEREAALTEFTAPTPELTQPNDEELNSVLARAPEDAGIMQFAGTGVAEENEETFEELDYQILQSFMQSLQPVDEQPSSESDWEPS
jgi:SNF2 family DNA or RNA helicase